MIQAFFRKTCGVCGQCFDVDFYTVGAFVKCCTCDAVIVLPDIDLLLDSIKKGRGYVGATKRAKGRAGAKGVSK